jgi:ActR/RegA family two-component response regulator
MDNGYDSEAIHRLIREDLHADSIIPIRSWNNDAVGGTYRQEMAAKFDDARYRRRQLVENKFSVLKRKFSGDLKARRFGIQMKEIAGKMIVCNIHRFLQFLVIEVFYRAKRIIFGEVIKQHMHYRILIVDDDHKSNDRLLQKFKSEKHFVDCALSFAEAVEYLAASRSAPYDLVILDIILDPLRKGGQKGNDVIKWIKQHRIKTRIIVYTGVCKDRSHIVQYVKDGVCDYLFKETNDENTVYNAAIKAISFDRTINTAMIYDSPAIYKDVINEYEMMMKQLEIMMMKQTSPTFTIIGSQYIDKSINIQNFSHVNDYIEKNIPDLKKQQELIKQLKELESTQKTPEYLLHYQKFIGTLANHITVFLPVITFLGQYFPK